MHVNSSCSNSYFSNNSHLFYTTFIWITYTSSSTSCYLLGSIAAMAVSSFAQIQQQKLCIAGASEVLNLMFTCRRSHFHLPQVRISLLAFRISLYSSTQCSTSPSLSTKHPEQHSHCSRYNVIEMKEAAFTAVAAAWCLYMHAMLMEMTCFNSTCSAS
jgi:hypothetical protein